MKREEAGRLALTWAEEHGIVKYRVEGKYMIYNVSHSAYLNQPRYTVQFKVDLSTGKTVESKVLKRFDKTAYCNK